MNLNFWVLALFYKWATTEMVKQAMSFKDCSIEDLEEGVQVEYVTHDQYKEITDEVYKTPEAE
ncbi:XkdX family protein [Bacillus safensis]|uniref:XkdX family protein n=1 Tax=Bacillus safensis TaxID=561879 RepID=UPI00227FFC91|nr:XkdX family protein [Bacillus safensis]MCY7543882.1 XkdX family protein [Bacillus safensis]MCY7550370.1 XkdX family protein [Bacillus safensis]MCY7644018.1 XkdX family protein [Bacillus safensis]MCY7654544.1 XkdX family protein [Bacillus safensis]MEC3709141.1 XkdX family protein [Bacillus safensis]